VESLDNLKSKLIDEIREKLHVWNKLPYRLAGIWDGGSCSSYTSILIAGEAMRVWDAMVAAGNLKDAHRVAYRVLHSTSPYRAMLEELVSTGVCNKELRAEILAIAKIWCVERRIENAHAHIKRVVRACNGHCLPSKADAELRFEEHLDVLEDAKGYAFAIDNWSRRDLVKALLLDVGRTRAELKRCTPTQQLNLIFCSDMSQMHQISCGEDSVPRALSAWESLKTTA